MGERRVLVRAEKFGDEEGMYRRHLPSPDNNPHAWTLGHYSEADIVDPITHEPTEAQVEAVARAMVDAQVGLPDEAEGNWRAWRRENTWREFEPHARAAMKAHLRVLLSEAGKPGT